MDKISYAVIAGVMLRKSRSEDMKMSRKLVMLTLFIALSYVSVSKAGAPTTINDFTMPGSQPNETE